MYIKSITFKQDFVYDITRKNQKRFPEVKGEKSMFKLFEKDLKVEFKDEITVIVGDNGIGKTSFLKMLKYTPLEEAFMHTNTEEDHRKHFMDYLDNELTKIQIVKGPIGIMLLDKLHKNHIQEEKRAEIQKRTHNGRLRFDEFGDMWQSKDFSNGEALLDIYAGLEDFKKAVIILDEPETSMSLKSLQILRDMINIMLKNDNQVIVSTHNPYIMRMCEEVYDMEEKKYVKTDEYLQRYGM